MSVANAHRRTPTPHCYWMRSESPSYARRSNQNSGPDYFCFYAANKAFRPPYAPVTSSMPESIPPRLSRKGKQRGNENAWSCLPPPWVVSFRVINVSNHFISVHTNSVTVKHTTPSSRCAAKKHVRWVTLCHFGWDSQDHVPSDLPKHRSTWEPSSPKNENVRFVSAPGGWGKCVRPDFLRVQSLSPLEESGRRLSSTSASLPCLSNAGECFKSDLDSVAPVHLFCCHCQGSSSATVSQCLCWKETFFSGHFCKRE